MIEVGRDKADLKAVRESIGINQIDLANQLRVTVRTIKRWEQIGWEEPPAEVWDLLEDLVRRHEQAVDQMVREAEEALQEPLDANEAQDATPDDKPAESDALAAADKPAESDAPAEDGAPCEVTDAPADASEPQGFSPDEPKVVYLAYFKNQKHYDCFPHPRGAQHAWGNAITRRAADILRMRGYRVLFYYPEASFDTNDMD